MMLKHRLLFFVILCFVNAVICRAKPINDTTFYSIEDAKEHPLKVEILVLRDQNLKEIPEEIRSFKNLKEIDLARNEIVEIPGWISDFKYLSELDLSENKLDSLPDSFGKLTNLEVINLSGNALKHLPPSMGFLCKLVELYLTKNELSDLPNSFEKLDNLLRLRLDNNSFEKVPESIFKLESIKRIELSDNRIKVLPEAISRCTTLTALNIDYNSIEEIPEAIKSLDKLTTLSFANNKLKEIPDSLWTLTGITYLNFSKNNISYLSKDIGNLSSLSELIFSEDSLVSLPKTIGDLTMLTSIDFSNNQLQKIPNISKLEFLTNLNFSNNDLDSIPESIGDLSYLQEVNLSSNNIPKVPLRFFELVNLTNIDLSYNDLNSIPGSIKNLIQVTKLNLSNNNLNKLPSSITHLKNLSSLNLNSNEFKSIPFTENMNPIDSIFLDSNYFSKIDVRTKSKYLSIKRNQEKIKNFNISELNDIREIDLSYSKIGAVTGTNNANIQTIILKHCDIGFINISSYSLKELYLSFNSLKDANSFIVNTANLKVLDINNNPFQEFPEYVASFKKLISFSAYDLDLAPDSYPKCDTCALNVAYGNMCRFYAERKKVDKKTKELIAVGLLGIITLLFLIYSTILYRRNSRQKDEIQDSYNKLRKTQEKLREKERKAFIADRLMGIRHDLKTPIHNSLSSVENLNEIMEILVEKILSHTLTEPELIKLKDEYEKLANIFKRSNSIAQEYILAFGTITKDQVRNTKETIHDLSMYIQQLIITYGFKLRNNRITLLNNIPEGIRINSYPGYISSILQNLIDNAIEHGLTVDKTINRQILISAQLHHDVITILVENNGKPIPPEKLPFIFNQDYTTKKTEIGGYGLYSVKQTIEEGLKGTIKCKSGTDHTIFIVEFPV